MVKEQKCDIVIRENNRNLQKKEMEYETNADQTI
jgi:hypothetical protein